MYTHTCTLPHTHVHTERYTVNQAILFLRCVLTLPSFLFFLVFACVPVFLYPSQVVSGQLVFSVTRGSTRPVRLRLDQVQVADGRWHDLQLELRDVRSGRETRYVATLRLDFGLYQVINVKQRHCFTHTVATIRTQHNKPVRTCQSIKLRLFKSNQIL